MVLSYGSGLTAMRLLPYAAATALGILPSTVVQVGVGASAPALVSGATAAVALPLAALVLAGVVWFRRRRAGLSPPEQPAQRGRRAAHRAGRELQDRAARDARHLLDDRCQLQQAADVVHPQLPPGRGGHRVDPAGRRLEQQLRRALHRRALVRAGGHGETRHPPDRRRRTSRRPASPG